MMQLAIMFKTPLHEIMKWPVSHLRIWATWLIRERTPLERLEIAAAQICAVIANANRKKGSKVLSISDFLIFKDLWNKIQKTGNDDFDHDLSLLVNALTKNGSNKLVIKRQ